MKAGTRRIDQTLERLGDLYELQRAIRKYRFVQLPEPSDPLQVNEPLQGKRSKGKGEV